MLDKVLRLIDRKQVRYEKIFFYFLLKIIKKFIDKKKFMSVLVDVKGYWFLTKYNFYIFSNSKDRILEIDQNGYWEEIESQFILNNLKSNDTFIDIGANIGYFSLLASTVTDKVYCIEAVPSTYNMLQNNIKFNQRDIKAFNIAMSGSDNDGELLFPKNPSPKNHVLNSKKLDNTETILVKSKSFDLFVMENGIKQIDFIKIDIEGYEYFFLEGARKSIEKNDPIILIEIEDSRTQKFGIKAEKIFDYFKSLNYRYYVVSENENKLIEPSGMEEDLNKARDFVFIPLGKEACLNF